MDQDRTWIIWASRQLIDQVDWTHPNVVKLKPDTQTMTDEQAMAKAIAVVRQLRERTFPIIGYQASDIQGVRQSTTETQKKEYADQLLAAIQTKRTRKVGLCSVPSQVLHAGATPEIFMQQPRVLGTTPPGHNPLRWGTVAMILDGLEKCWAMYNCPDVYVVYMLAWLTEQLPAEWAWAQTWDETMLGNAGHNWWLHTLSGMWKAGLYFPELKGLATFQSLAPNYINHEITTLFKPDGFSRERSGYHFGMADLADELAYIAKLHNISLSEQANDHLTAMANVPWKLIAPDGGIPHLGDGFRGTYSDGPYFFTLQRLAGRYQIPQSKYVAQQLPDRGGSDSMHIFHTNYQQAYDALTAKAPTRVDTELPDSGYYIMRENWTPTADWMCIDAGSTGVRGASHDHADIFGITAYAKGQPILLDNGAGAYDNKADRLWRISTAAHNAATVDGASALEIQDQWRRGNRVIPEIESWITMPNYAYFSGVHDGYELREVNVTAHRRKIFYLRGEYWIVIDRFTANDPEQQHEYTQHWHLTPPVTQASPTHTIAYSQLADSAPKAGVVCVAAQGLTVLRESNPYPNAKTDNPDHLTHSLQTKGSGILVTVIAPFTGDTPPTMKVESLQPQCDGKPLSAWQATALAITFNGRRDIYFDQHMHWSLRTQIDQDHVTESRLYHSRIQSLTPAISK